ncbi:MAG: hypothetical protein ACMUIU_01545 [bacterium]
MSLRRTKIRRKTKSRQLYYPQESNQENEHSASKAEANRASSFYSAGPVFGLYTMEKKNENNTKQNRENLPSVSPIQGRGDPELVTVSSNNLRLSGRTDAQFDGGRFWTENVRVRPGQDCRNCSGDDCLHLTGRLVARYRVTTTVTLPSADDFPDLTPCQRRRVQDAIDNVLAPHEQDHVRAFETYNGTTRRHFDLTICRSEFESTIRSMFEEEERERRNAAQAASDSLDPFHIDVNLNCEEEQESAGEGGVPGGDEGEDEPED